MRRIKLWAAAAAVFGLSLIGEIFGQTVGDEVVVFVKQTDLKHETTTVKTAYRGTYLTVKKVNGNWLWVELSETQGWLNKDHVIPASQGIKYFTNELRRNSKDTTALVARAEAWNNKGEFTNAIKDCTEAIAIDSRSSGAFSARGHAWKRKGEYGIAIADYTEAIRLDPMWGGYYFGRAKCHSLNKNEQASIADVTEAIRLNPKDADYFEYRAMAHGQN